jgi:hypothetical protein
MEIKIANFLANLQIAKAHFDTSDAFLSEMPLTKRSTDANQKEQITLCEKKVEQAAESTEKVSKHGQAMTQSCFA